ncbi:Uncharacterised protein [Mobiluncus curtisii]|uniref:Uncharacterized protein n=1 Tax=Mobiluncus curtisii TaxID=2051 RepID=A0A2X3BQI8_9ACTO|nr:Uncharacterised protein [Mobiluncus curtisii]
MKPYPEDVKARLVREGQEIISRYPEGHSRSALLPLLASGPV